MINDFYKLKKELEEILPKVSTLKLAQNQLGDLII